MESRQIANLKICLWTAKKSLSLMSMYCHTVFDLYQDSIQRVENPTGSSRENQNKRKSDEHYNTEIEVVWAEYQINRHI